MREGIWRGISISSNKRKEMRVQTPLREYNRKETHFYWVSHMPAHS